MECGIEELIRNGQLMEFKVFELRNGIWEYREDAEAGAGKKSKAKGIHCYLSEYVLSVLS